MSSSRPQSSTKDKGRRTMRVDPRRDTMSRAIEGLLNTPLDRKTLRRIVKRMKGFRKGWVATGVLQAPATCQRGQEKETEHAIRCILREVDSRPKSGTRRASSCTACPVVANIWAGGGGASSNRTAEPRDGGTVAPYGRGHIQPGRIGCPSSLGFGRRRWSRDHEWIASRREGASGSSVVHFGDWYTCVPVCRRPERRLHARRNPTRCRSGISWRCGPGGSEHRSRHRILGYRSSQRIRNGKPPEANSRRPEGAKAREEAEGDPALSPI